MHGLRAYFVGKCAVLVLYRFFALGRDLLWSLG
jgi:hypothetical protein